MVTGLYGFFAIYEQEVERAWERERGRKRTSDNGEECRRRGRGEAGGRKAL
jgi:hypothetical protein